MRESSLFPGSSALELLGTGFLGNEKLYSVDYFARAMSQSFSFTITLSQNKINCNLLWYLRPDIEKDYISDFHQFNQIFDCL